MHRLCRSLFGDVRWANTEAVRTNKSMCKPAATWAAVSRCVLCHLLMFLYQRLQPSIGLVGRKWRVSLPFPTRWLLGNILCIEDSGGSSVLMFTQSAHDHNIPVSDNKSWLGFKVKNNSLLTFFPSGSAQQKKCVMQPKHCGNTRCKVSSVTYWLPAFPLVFSLSLLATPLQTKASLLPSDSLASETES